MTYERVKPNYKNSCVKRAGYYNNSLLSQQCGKKNVKAEETLEMLRLISGFRRKVDENFVLLGCYAASRGDLLRTFRDNLSASSSRVTMGFLTLEYETDIVPKRR